PFRSPRPREVQLLGEEDQLRQQQTGPSFDPKINFTGRVAAVACQRLEVFGNVPAPGIKATIQKQLSPLEPRPQPRERRATGNQSRVERRHRRILDGDQGAGKRDDREAGAAGRNSDPRRAARSQQEIGVQAAGGALYFTLAQKLARPTKSISELGDAVPLALRVALVLLRERALGKDAAEDGGEIETLGANAGLRVRDTQVVHAVAAVAQLPGEGECRIQIRRPVKRHENNRRHVRFVWRSINRAVYG